MALVLNGDQKQRSSLGCRFRTLYDSGVMMCDDAME